MNFRQNRHGHRRQKHVQHRVMMGQASQLITGSFQGFTSLDLATHAALKPRSFSIARHRAGPSRGQPSRMSLRFFWDAAWLRSTLSVSTECTLYLLQGLRELDDQLLRWKSAGISWKSHKWMLCPMPHDSAVLSLLLTRSAKA